MCMHVFVSQQLELQSANSVYLCVFLWVETEVLLLLLQKYSQTSQVILTTRGYIIKGRVT